jgi:hypothetical protein
VKKNCASILAPPYDRLRLVFAENGYILLNDPVSAYRELDATTLDDARYISSGVDPDIPTVTLPEISIPPIYAFDGSSISAIFRAA